MTETEQWMEGEARTWCNEAYGGGWIMRGRESEPKVRRKSGNKMGRRRGAVGGALLPNSGPSVGTHGSVCLRNCSCSSALLNNQEVGERIDRPDHGARL